NTNFEAEIRYDDFGSVDFVPGVEASLTALGLGIKGIIPLNDQFNLYAKFGFASWDLEGKIDGEKGSESGSDIYYGFGAQFFANDNVALSVEYSMLTAGAEGNIDYDVTNIGVSLGYYF
ncbi:MAG TPA: outer membrane beta-barrel protein, partial [Marinagarivorans sp.]